MNDKLIVWVLVVVFHSKITTSFLHLQYNKYLSLSGKLSLATSTAGNWIFKQITTSQRKLNNFEQFYEKNGEKYTIAN